MGTTESAFFYEDNDEASPPPQQHSASAAATRRPSIASGSSATPPPVTKRKGPPRTVAKRSSAANHRPASVKLKGHILGLPESGKRTLLARLKGKDPFHPSTDDDLAPVLAEGSEQHFLPYQAPSDQPSWDRIQLLVDCAENFVSRDDPLDFAVVLINPQHKRKKVKRYLVERLHRLLHMLGYRTDGLIEMYPLRPFCLCVLLNYRDLTLSKSHVEESHVTTWTMEVLQDYPSLDPQRLVLQCGQTSLLNCYGLSLLHHFIYQSYLFYRQFHLEYELLQVRQTQQQTKAPHVQDYGEFLAILDGKVSPRKARPPQDPDASGRRKVMPQAGERSNSIVQQERPPTPPPPKSSKNALDDFLASSDDDEEEDVPNPSTNSSHRKHKSRVESDGEDEDDDFVVNEVLLDSPEVSENNEPLTGKSNGIVDRVDKRKTQHSRETTENDTQRQAGSAKSQESTANSSDASVASKQTDDEIVEKVVEHDDDREKSEASVDVDASNKAKEKVDNDVESEDQIEPKAPENTSDAPAEAENDTSHPVGKSAEQQTNDQAETDQASIGGICDQDTDEDNHGKKGRSVSNTAELDFNDSGSEDERSQAGEKADIQSKQNKTVGADQARELSSNAHDEAVGSVENSNLAESPNDETGSANKAREAKCSTPDDSSSEEEFFVGESESQDISKDGGPSADLRVSVTKGSAMGDDSSHEAESVNNESDTGNVEGTESDKEVQQEETNGDSDGGSRTVEANGRDSDGASRTDVVVEPPKQLQEKDDEDEFVIQETTAAGRIGTGTTETSETSSLSVTKPVDETETKRATSGSLSEESKVPSENPSGLSAAAMAAIAAAQKDFESMLQPAGGDAAKKKKKKKDKEAKEKKKDKKKKKEAAG